MLNAFACTHWWPLYPSLIDLPQDSSCYVKPLAACQTHSYSDSGVHFLALIHRSSGWRHWAGHRHRRVPNCSPFARPIADFASLFVMDFDAFPQVMLVFDSGSAVLVLLDSGSEHSEHLYVLVACLLIRQSWCLRDERNRWRQSLVGWRKPTRGRFRRSQVLPSCLWQF